MGTARGFPMATLGVGPAIIPQRAAGRREGTGELPLSSLSLSRGKLVLGQTPALGVGPGIPLQRFRDGFCPRTTRLGGVKCFFFSRHDPIQLRPPKDKSRSATSDLASKI